MTISVSGIPRLRRGMPLTESTPADSGLRNQRDRNPQPFPYVLKNARSVMNWGTIGAAM